MNIINNTFKNNNNKVYQSIKRDFFLGYELFTMDYAYNKPRTEETYHSYLVAKVNVKNIDLTIKLVYDNSDTVHLTTLYKAPGKKRSIKLKERNINIANINLKRAIHRYLDEDMHTIDSKLKLNVISYLHVNIQFNN